MVSLIQTLLLIKSNRKYERAGRGPFLIYSCSPFKPSNPLPVKKILLTLLSFGSLLTSCKQTEVKPEITVQNISGNYILKDVRMSATGIPEQDAFSSLPKCEIDDLYE